MAINRAVKFKKKGVLRISGRMQILMEKKPGEGVNLGAQENTLSVT